MLTTAPPDATPADDTPLPDAALKLVAMAKESLVHHFDATPGSSVDPHGYATTADGGTHLYALLMPLMDIRMMFKRELPRIGAVAVVHVTESWAASVPVDDPEAVALMTSLRDQGRLQDMPKQYLREVITLFVETPDIPVRAEELLITVAPDGTRSLDGEWTPKLLAYPRPTFRRYYPEGGR